MKCHGCGHEFPNTSTRCPRCHRSTSRRGRASTDSRLLEFPRRARVAQPAEAPSRPLPAWRVELNEKVRAIKANRDASIATIEPPAEEMVNTFEADPRTAGTSALQHAPRSPYSRDAVARSAAPRPESNQPATSPATSARRSSNNIVEAALIRVKRATENASRAALPKIEPARPIQASPQVSLAVDRQATALALDPAPEIESRPEPTPAPRPEVVAPAIIKPAPVEAAAAAESEILPPPNTDYDKKPSVLVLDEIEPLDYLEAEIRKVDEKLGREFLKNESPSIFTHAVIGVADLLAVAVSCSPFLAFIRIADGSFTVAQTRLASGAIVTLIAFFYLALTQCLCGRTFGMMLTNTRVVDARAFEAPSPSQALLRTVGYFVAAAPALAGIVWAAFDHKRRGWHDFISGTVVVRDF